LNARSFWADRDADGQRNRNRGRIGLCAVRNGDRSNRHSTGRNRGRRRVKSRRANRTGRCASTGHTVHLPRHGSVRRVRNCRRKLLSLARYNACRLRAHGHRNTGGHRHSRCVRFCVIRRGDGFHRHWVRRRHRRGSRVETCRANRADCGISAGYTVYLPRHGRVGSIRHDCGELFGGARLHARRRR